MRNLFLGVLAAAVIVSAGAGTAFAAGPGCGRHFSDADGDGVCDNARSICIYADTERACDVCGINHGDCPAGEGAAFLDADGDGICDNRGACHRCDMAGVGYGGNFVDADGNGVCDNWHCGGSGRGFRGGHNR